MVRMANTERLLPRATTALAKIRIGHAGPDRFRMACGALDYDGIGSVKVEAHRNIHGLTPPMRLGGSGAARHARAGTDSGATMPQSRRRARSSAIATTRRSV